MSDKAITECEMGGCDRYATHRVGTFGEAQLVCEPCLDWGDTRRWWNTLPRQTINLPRFYALVA